MSMSVICPRCDNEIATPKATGRAFSCPNCGARLMAPDEDRPTNQRERLQRNPEPRERDSDRRAERPSRRERAFDRDDREDRARTPPADEGMGLAGGLGLSSLIIGLISLAFAIIPCVGVFSLPISAVGLVLGLSGGVVAMRREGRGVGFPIAGSFFSLLAIAVGCIWGLWMFQTYRDTREVVENTQNAMQQAEEFRQQQEKLRPQKWANQEKKAAGNPIAQAWDANGVAYLSELAESDIRVGFGRMGKRGKLGYGTGGFDQDRDITVGGNRYPNALSLHPPSRGYSSVKYRLDKQARQLKGWAGMNDRLPPHHDEPASALTFKILGDGKELWSSQPIRTYGTALAFDVNVTGVTTLELQAHCPGQYDRVMAVWLDPQVIR